jgi:hypothetical protein
MATLYNNIGKKYKDLWKKKYDFKNQIKVNQKYAPSVDSTLILSTSGTLKSDGVVGTQTVKYKDLSFGTVEGEADTEGKLWAKSEFNKFHKGTKATLSGGFDPLSKDPVVKESWSVKVEGEHVQDIFTVTGAVTVGEQKEIVFTAAASASVTYQDATVGGEVQVDHTQNLSDYNVGAQYTYRQGTAAVVTEKKGEVFKASGVYEFSPKFVGGVEVVHEEKRTSLNFASEYRVDALSTLKLKSSPGEIAGAVEHRLLNPLLTVNVSALWKTKGTQLKVDKVGVALTFGEE